MAKKNARNTRGKIVSAAWKLFYEQGYEDTTVEDPRERRGGATLHFDSASDSRKGILIRHVVDVSPAVQASADRALSVADKAVEAATKATSSFSLAPIVFAGVGGLVVGALLAAAWSRASYRPRRIEPRE